MTEENGFATAWKPQPGETITGKVVEAGMIDPNGKGKYLCVTLERSDGELYALHCFHQVLRNEIARARPKVGYDVITVTYNGKKEGGSFGGYNSYSVSGGQAKEVDWDALLPAGERDDPFVQAPPIPPAPVPAAPVASPSAPAGEKFGDDLPF